MLPPMDHRGLLPPANAPYAATFAEVHDRFVTEAPFPEARQRVFDALTLYASLIWDVLPNARLRINGGFTTHKQWAAPEDADVVVVYRAADAPHGLDAAVAGPLFTVLQMSGRIGEATVRLPKAHVMGGLIDAFPAPEELEPVLRSWHHFWSTVTGPDKTVIPGEYKGYVEVSNPNVEQ